MRLITCNIQMFSNDQMIQVIDSENTSIYYQKVDIADLPRVICALAHQNDIEKVLLSGGSYCDLWAEEIRQTYGLNYGINKNFEVEVL